MTIWGLWAGSSNQSLVWCARGFAHPLPDRACTARIRVLELDARKRRPEVTLCVRFRVGFGLGHVAPADTVSE